MGTPNPVGGDDNKNLPNLYVSGSTRIGSPIVGCRAITRQFVRNDTSLSTMNQSSDVPAKTPGHLET